MKRTIPVNKYVKYASFTIALIVLTIAVFSYYFYVYTPKSIFETSKNKSYDVIIVPGVPYDEAHWSAFMKWRVYWSVFLYKQGLTKNIIYTGSAVHTPYIEANIMKKYGEKLGIPSQNILTETKAEHSSENLYYSYILAQKKGFKNIALATDPFQTDMLDDFIEKYKLKVDVLPIVYHIADTINMKEPAIDYKSEKINDFIPLSKRETFLQRLKGTQGMKIDWNTTSNSIENQ